ncbi:MAG: 1-acyl-sn-glycerol-3-phosphate acyltransferase, partial [Syntrophobacterales bacterium]|nr:1-acyl-sn-glycerol-3-phosphate acyltransferase [Syntrophobacterales bacterium]
MLVKFLALIVRIILKIRYKISFSGLELIKDQKHALFLPNHPAEIDPIILVAHFLKFTRIRPIVVERFFETPPGRFVLNLINAFAIPDMAFDGGFYKRKRTENTIKAINDAIKKGDNLIIYPSGQITNGGLEKIGGNSGVHSILQGAHNAEVFLIKTTGLRGSSFSKAFTGVTPPFFPALLNGIKIAFKNLIFFTPKRNVSIQIVKAPASFPKNGDPLSINHWLEDWYNKDGEEEITLVPYYFWKKE